MEKTFHILTDNPIIFNINDNWFEINHYKTFSLQESITYNCIAFFNNELYQPFAFILDSNLSSTYPNLESYKFDENSLFIKVNELISNQNLLIKDNCYTIYNGYATYYNQTKLHNGRFYATFCKKFFETDYSAYSLDNQNKKLFLALNSNKCLLSAKYDIIEFDDNTITMLNNLNDNFNQAIVTKYSKNDLSILEKYSVYTKQINPLSTNFVNICDYFLQAGIGLNKNLCDKFLCDELKNNFSIENFLSFFGEIEYFYKYYVSPTRVKILVKSSNFQCYNFNLSQNKIIDIEKI